MRLSAWMKKQEPGTRAKMHRALGQHSGALDRAHRGQRISYANAVRISAITDGAVSIAELCNPAEAPMKRGGR